MPRDQDLVQYCRDFIKTHQGNYKPEDEENWLRLIKCYEMVIDEDNILSDQDQEVQIEPTDGEDVLLQKKDLIP